MRAKKKGRSPKRGKETWFKVAVSVIDSEDPEIFRSWCLC